MTEPVHIISLGAGVQSSTMALMAGAGEITPMPKAAIFADTKAEPLAVYKHLKWLKSRLPFPVITITEKRGLLSMLVRSLRSLRFASVPFFTESASGGGILRRQCTKEFKVIPVKRAIRALLGPGRHKVIQWIGISVDEASRMKPSRVPWITNRFPLAMELGMSRHACLRWLGKYGYQEPPKSACTFCPYHNNATWAAFKLADGYEWRQAVAVDRLIRGGVRGTKEKLYLHRSLKPLELVDFSTEEERGQLNMFNNECEGMCGV